MIFAHHSRVRLTVHLMLVVLLEFQQSQCFLLVPFHCVAVILNIASGNVGKIGHAFGSDCSFFNALVLLFVADGHRFVAWQVNVSFLTKMSSPTAMSFSFQNKGSNMDVPLRN